MKRILLLLIGIIMCMFMYANEFHYYFSMNSQGEVVSYEISENEYTVTINDLIISANHYVSCDMTIKCPHSAENYTVLRRHADGNPGDANDPYWNMQTQPAVNPRWCSYEVIESNESGCTIRFVDTFPMHWYTDELSTANALKYYLYDAITGHILDIQIQNVFYYNIITNVEEIVKDNQPTIYYDLHGHSSNFPFNGINIVKKRSKTYKKIF